MSELRNTNHVRITLGGHVRFTSRIYVIKPCKWGQNITEQLRSEVTPELQCKNYVRITLESYVRFMLHNYVMNHANGDEKLHSNYVSSTPELRCRNYRSVLR